MTKHLENTQEEQTPAEIENENTIDLSKEWTILRDMSIENIIGDISKGVSTRRQLGQLCINVIFVSQVELKNINEASKDENWYLAMQEEHNQFKRNNV